MCYTLSSWYFSWVSLFWDIAPSCLSSQMPLYWAGRSFEISQGAKVHAVRSPFVAPAGCQCGAATWPTNAKQTYLSGPLTAFTKHLRPSVPFLLRRVADLCETNPPLQSSVQTDRSLKGQCYCLGLGLSDLWFSLSFFLQGQLQGLISRGRG